MFNRLTSMNRNAITMVGIGLVIAVFLCLNIVIGGLFSSTRLDLTEDRIFTLSEGTEEVLASVDEPITLRYYRSEQLDDLGPVYANHARRIDSFLNEYARLSAGKVRIERYDPQPFSPEEDLAVSDGLEGIPVDNGAGQIYFGIAGSNSTDDVKAITYLPPERGNFLEYDLTRLVHDLANPQKSKVAVIGDFPLRGTRLNGFRPSAVLEVMRQFFEVENLYGSQDSIGDDVEVLVLAQPRDLDEKTLYAIDQFAMRGGKILAFLDPHAEAMAVQGPQVAPGSNAIETMEPLLKAWGVEIPKDRFVGDREGAFKVRAQRDGRNVIVDYLAWLGLGEDRFASNDVITANLKQVNFRTAGLIRTREGATTTLEPLVTTSSEAAELDVNKVKYMPDPVKLWEGFTPEGENFVLAGRVLGDIKSAFTEGPPENVEDESLRSAHLSDSRAPLNLVLVADADVLADQTWVQRQALLGQEFMIPAANNGDFVVNALDNLTGSQGLIALRGRGLTVRPFERVDEMAREAEARLRGKEQELLARIKETQEKIGDLQQQQHEGGVILTADQQETIESFRAEMIDLRRELRDVRYDLNKDVENLEFWLKFVNIWAIPLLLGVLAVTLASVRRWRAARFHAAARR